MKAERSGAGAAALTTLVLGGARSGKSAHAEALIAAEPAPWHYIATAEARDEEMRARIAAHRARRATQWVTHEVPIDLPDTLYQLAERAQPVLVDCLTLWLSNLIERACDVEVASDALDAALAALRAPCALVSNEVGLGVMPANALARRFGDAAGRLNQRIAARADRVVLMTAGLPLVLKPSPTQN